MRNDKELFESITDEERIRIIKGILYKHALESQFQFAKEEFEKQLELLNRLKESLK